MTAESKPMSEAERLELAATDYADHMAAGGRWTASYHDTKTTFKAGYEACAKSKDAALTDLQKQVDYWKAQNQQTDLYWSDKALYVEFAAAKEIEKLQQQIADYKKALKDIYSGDGLIPVDGKLNREQKIAFEALTKIRG